MNTETKSENEMTFLGKILGIFTSPTETFQSIDRKPTWFLAFVVIITCLIITQFLILDIRVEDQLAMMEAQDAPAERLEMARSQSSGGLKYIQLGVMPIAVLLANLVIAGIYILLGNAVMGGDTRFKKVLSVVVWTGFIGIIQSALHTYLTLSKGTSHGVTTSLAVAVPTPPIGQSTPFYRFLASIDIFTIWSIILLIIGFSVIFNFSRKKSSIMVVSLWIVWTALVVFVGGFFAQMSGIQ